MTRFFLKPCCAFLSLKTSLVACVSLLSCCQQESPPLEFVDSENAESEGASNSGRENSSLAKAKFAPDPTLSGVNGELAPAETQRSVRFVSYNVWNYLNRAREGEPPRFKSEAQIQALVEILLELRPDVLGLSEIGTLEDLFDLQQRLREAGLELPAYAWTRGEDGGRNLALLSALPLIQASNPMLSYTLTHRDGTKVNTQLERGILDVTIQLGPELELHTLGVHFKSKREVDYASQELIRSSEAQLLRDHSEEILRTEPETKLLVYGDFNDTNRSRTLEIVRGAHRRGEPLRLIDLPLVDENGDRWTHYWEYQDVYSRFDYLFVNPALEQQVNLKQSGVLSGTGYRRASDHRPLYLTIEANPN